MPRYGRISIEKFGLELILENVQVPLDEQNEPVRIFQGTLGKDVPVYFVDNARYFDRESIYMYPDDAERFTLFSRAALEMLKPLGFKPDIIHCNDWHTALIPNWLKTVYKDDPFLR
jgi:starch synthase